MANNYKLGDICIRPANNTLVEVTYVGNDLIGYRFLNTSRVGHSDALGRDLFRRLHRLAGPSAIVLFGCNEK